MDTAQGRIPAQVTSFIGRRQQSSEAGDLLNAHRLLTVLGPGGVGKTRFAVEVAIAESGRFRDGARFVSLVELSDPADVAEAVMAALALRFSSADVVDNLVAAVSRYEMLLVLDNCEHVLSGCQALTSRLLRAAPGLRILATSRERLGVQGERILELHPLQSPEPGHRIGLPAARRYEAIMLLEERARAVCPHHELTEANLEAAIALVHRLDGLPLAIELAAARLRSLSLEELLARVDDRFRMLAGGDPTGLPQHRTLRALVEWSHDLCSPAEQRLWARMSVFAGSTNLEAIEAVCGEDGTPEVDLLDTLDGLVAKSILTTAHTPHGTRYRMLESLSEFGRERLIAAGERDILTRRHRRYYRDLALRITGEFWGNHQHELLTRLEADHRNFGAACDSLTADGEGEAAMSLAAALRVHWVMGGHLQEGRRRLEQLLDRHHDTGSERAEALWSCVWIASLQGDPEGAQRHIAECERLADHGADTANFCQSWHGNLALFRGDLEQAVLRFTAAAVGHRANGTIEGLLLTLFQLALAHSLLGEHEEAARISSEAIAVSEAHGDQWMLSYTLWAQAHDRLLQGRSSDATRLALRSLEIKHAFSDRLGTALLVEVLAAAAVAGSRFVEGATSLGVADTMWAEIGTSLRAFGPQLAETRAVATTRARAALGAEAFEAAHREGADMFPAEVWTHLCAIARFESQQAVETPPRGPAALTKRERQVAAYVGKGLSNKEIAKELVLSHRTVEGHVEHVLAKLGLRSRAEIAVWAATRS
ncbi:hypothetical protein BAY59_27620 [Prauserella coralliicola]|nr:hypothetical protein BAY59_27620 [Prauserella coralliicola]